MIITMTPLEKLSHAKDIAHITGRNMFDVLADIERIMEKHKKAQKL